jgi:hypothetical protein
MCFYSYLDSRLKTRIEMACPIKILFSYFISTINGIIYRRLWVLKMSMCKCNQWVICCSIYMVFQHMFRVPRRPVLCLVSINRPLCTMVSFVSATEISSSWSHPYFFWLSISFNQMKTAYCKLCSSIGPRIWCSDITECVTAMLDCQFNR